jgi:hypothetical protein
VHLQHWVLAITCGWLDCELLAYFALCNTTCISGGDDTDWRNRVIYRTAARRAMDVGVDRREYGRLRRGQREPGHRRTLAADT